MASGKKIAGCSAAGVPVGVGDGVDVAVGMGVGEGVAVGGRDVAVLVGSGV